MNRGQYLAHYGVLGMKWGIRKNPEYSYTSRLTKKYGRKADKYAVKGKMEKADEYRQMQKRSAVLDKRQEEYARRVTAKGNILCRGLTGGILGGTSYTRILAAMNGQGAGDKGKKRVAFILANRGGWFSARKVNKDYVTGRIDDSSAYSYLWSRNRYETMNREMNRKFNALNKQQSKLNRGMKKMQKKF